MVQGKCMQLLEVNLTGCINIHVPSFGKMTFEEIHTERLILRSLTQDVYDHVFSVYSEDAL